ncbi:unnamed protein product [Hermetia illucens]|uniref:Uncharacterized protein n=1 Tax=Hermetia illucens TaxID=343691 RepID=A0A7R8UN33_HERIL|nr:eukaryotic translation initiation factor 5B-like [Hermetia illucens]CAD7083846.1 unnamed protein product [Hermetia illucens]
MKLLIVFLAVLVISTAVNSKDEPKKDEPKKDEPKTDEPKTDESKTDTTEEEDKEKANDVAKRFEERAVKTLQAITDNTKEVIELAKDAVEKSVTKAETEAAAALKRPEEIVEKFKKIKSKVEKDLKECNDKFLGDASILGHLLAREKQLRELLKELKECPTDNINGMGCTLGKLIRGEDMRKEVESIVESEKGTPKERATAIIEWVEKCNERAVESATKAIKEFMTEVKECTKKDEL